MSVNVLVHVRPFIVILKNNPKKYLDINNFLPYNKRKFFYKQKEFKVLPVNLLNFSICYNHKSDPQEYSTQIFTYLMPLIPFTIGIGIVAYKLATRKITQITNTAEIPIEPEVIKSELIDKSLFEDFDPDSFSTNEKTYRVLRSVLEQERPTIYVTDEIGKHQEEIQGVLSGGQYKKAYKLSGDRALLLPNMDNRNRLFFPTVWKRMVKEEVKMSQFLNEIKLLSPDSRLVGVSISENSDEKIPAYISICFDAMKKAKGCYIIDGKDGHNINDSSTWVKGEKFLFKAEEIRMIVENWDSVTKKLIKEVLTLCSHGISIDSDCASIAIERKPVSKDCSISKYNIRYFGFDFSKSCMRGEEPNILANYAITEDDISFTIGIIMHRVLDYEFCNIASEQRQETKKLQNKIIERCVKLALSKQHKYI